MKHLTPVLIALIFTSTTGVLVTHAQGYTPLVDLPGVTTVGATTNMSAYLSGAIKLLIALGAAFSVLMAIIGGTQYVASGIAPDAKNDAKERIQGALVGLALVLSSYLILNSINPNLVAFNLGLPPVGTAPSTAGALVPTSSACPTPNDASAACCPPGVACQACSGCSMVSNVANKGCGVGVCFLNAALLSKIQSISVPGQLSWRITESWPPTVGHLSLCHQNGTCADLNNTGGSTQPAVIKILYDAFRAAGLSVLYESTNCAPYTAVGITNCATYSTMTNHSSFHVY